MHIIQPKVKDRVFQIINGTILGGSSLIKPKGGQNSYLSMRSKNGKWLDYKALQLGDFASSEPFTWERNTNRWHSLCYPLFTELRKKYYSNNKRFISVELLDSLKLKDIAFSIWFGDCGDYNNGIITYNTKVWGEEGTQEISKYFDLLGFKCEVFKIRKNFRIRLDFDSSQKLAKMIFGLMPQFKLREIN